MRRTLKEAGGWALQITKLHEVQLLAASSPSTRGSIIKHLFLTGMLPASNSDPYALEVVRHCLGRMPAAPAFRGPCALSLCKMAIWGHSLCLCIYSPASFLFRSLQRPALTRALSRWIGRGRTRDRRFKHLKMMLFDVVYRRQLEASCAFCARPSSSSLRREAAHPLCAVIG